MAHKPSRHPHGNTSTAQEAMTIIERFPIFSVSLFRSACSRFALSLTLLRFQPSLCSASFHFLGVVYIVSSFIFISFPALSFASLFVFSTFHGKSPSTLGAISEGEEEEAQAGQY